MGTIMSCVRGCLRQERRIWSSLTIGVLACAIACPAHAQEHRTLKVGSEVTSLALSPDGKLLATGMGSSTRGTPLKIWDVAKAELLAALECHDGRQVSGLAFSPDGKLLASAGHDKTVRLWNMEDKREIAILTEHEWEVWTVAFSRDGNRLATGGSDGTAKIWDVEARRVLETHKAHRNDVRAVAFSRDGKLLLTAGTDQLAYLWDLEKKDRVTTLRAHVPLQGALAFSPDGNTFAMPGVDKTVWVREVTEAVVPTIIDTVKHAKSLAFSVDGAILAIGSGDGMLELYDLKTRKPLAELKGHRQIICGLVFSRGDRTLFSGSSDGTVKLWNLTNILK